MPNQLLGAGECLVDLLRYARLAFHRQFKPVAMFRDRPNRIAPDDLAQADNGVGQVGIGDEGGRPDGLHQLVFGDESPGARDQAEECVEGFWAEGNRSLLALQQPLAGMQLEFAEAPGRLGHCLIFL